MDWTIYNTSANAIKAEGNSFGVTAAALIDSNINDKVDDPSLGRVDYNPLYGGVLPTGSSVPLAVSGLAAMPTGSGGMQVVFSLSVPSNVSVTICNVAGRVVRTLVTDRACGGTSTLIWDAQADNGVPAPNGTYLVEVVARATDGAQVRALTTVQVKR